MGEMLWFKAGFIKYSSPTSGAIAGGESDWLGYVLTDNAVMLAVASAAASSILLF